MGDRNFTLQGGHFDIPCSALNYEQENQEKGLSAHKKNQHHNLRDHHACRRGATSVLSAQKSQRLHWVCDPEQHPPLYYSSQLSHTLPASRSARAQDENNRTA